MITCNERRTDEIEDPACVPDTFCEEIVYIARLPGDCYRFTFAATGHGAEGDQRVVVARVIWSRAALLIAMEQVQAALEGLPFLSIAAPTVVPS